MKKLIIIRCLLGIRIMDKSIPVFQALAIARTLDVSGFAAIADLLHLITKRRSER